MVKKDRPNEFKQTDPNKMLPEVYQNHLKSQLSPAEYLFMQILMSLLQSIKQVSLEALATTLPLPVLFESRRKRIQRFLSLKSLKVETLWLPMISLWLETQLSAAQIVYLAIDRTSWVRVNLLMISLVWNHRGIPLYFELLPKLGSSNFAEQKAAFLKIFPLLNKYKIVVLGDREFCSVKLGSWLREQKVYFCLRLKKDTFIQRADEVWQELNDLGLKPGVSFYLQGMKVTKSLKIAGFSIACKWKRKYRGIAPEEGWFILTNLESLSAAINAYKRRFSIEEMFRDFKSGGYNLEGTNVSEERLISLILLIAIAYTSATIFGNEINQKGVQKYVGRVKEYGRIEKRHSSFYIGLYGQTWVNFSQSCGQLVAALMRLNRNKQKYYQQGQRAMELMLAAS